MSIRVQKILLPTDFSQNSAAATAYACDLATRFDAELHLLHALEIHPAAAPEFGMGLALVTHVSESRTAAEKAISRVVDPNWVSGRPVVKAIVEGSPRLEIIRYAREHDIDLIVISTHGRTGMSHVIMGSIAESVVRTASCPVLTIHPAGHRFEMP